MEEKTSVAHASRSDWTPRLFLVRLTASLLLSCTRLPLLYSTLQSHRRFPPCNRLLRTTPRLPGCCHPPGCLFFSLYFLPPFSAVQPPPSWLGIEPGPPAWESSTLPSEPPDVHWNMSLFLTSIVNIHAYCMLHSHPFSFIIKI